MLFFRGSWSYPSNRFTKQEGKISTTLLDKIANQDVISSHIVDNIIRTIVHTIIKTITENWHRKSQKDLLHVGPNNFNGFCS